MGDRVCLWANGGCVYVVWLCRMVGGRAWAVGVVVGVGVWWAWCGRGRRVEFVWLSYGCRVGVAWV